MAAADGTPFLRGGAFAFAIDGAIATVSAHDTAVEDLARRRDRGAGKRGLARREEADPARGWSSAVAERGLALRRRGGGSASCSSRPSGGLVVEEGTRRREEVAAASAALGVGGAACSEEPLVDPGVAFFCLAVL
ncbi:hypothetical protein HU200_056851 [Digitaria exilis]|uniref:Uncharacterized protein n=1 Tax=Digitaria exilis TaxID=1010633 RepID=A0A835AGW4_9POAL|nr:hypothetical protein HU200_056851 [Digitaria exilis]CAB3476942.1 unnamed protein product [Digitaria exilis]